MCITARFIKERQLIKQITKYNSELSINNLNINHKKRIVKHLNLYYRNTNNYIWHISKTHVNKPNK